MEQRIRDRFQPPVLDAVCTRYQIPAGAIRALDGFESFIFEFDAPGMGQPGSYILRLSHSLRRTENLIRGEIDWLNYLAAGGASVAQAVPSPAGNLVEPIDDGVGGIFFATAFAKADGDQPWNVGWSPELYVSYGRLIGKLHALTKDFAPSRPEWRRPVWDDPIFMFVDQFLPAHESIAHERYRVALAQVRRLPRDRDSYGLTHQDAHGGNMHVDATGRLTLFDFDDCGYHWFANDIAMVLFYMAMGKQHTPEFAADFLTHFLRGYRQENTLGDGWLSELPVFLKIREIELYAVMYREFDIADGDLSKIDDAWCAAYMQGRKARIDSGAPYLDMDFAALVV